MDGVVPPPRIEFTNTDAAPVVDAPEYLYDVAPERREAVERLRKTLAEEAAVTEYNDPDPLLIQQQAAIRFDEAVYELYREAWHLLLDKHKNYGPTNISRSPGGPLNGLRVRMHDKIARLNHMIDNNVGDAVGEALEETLMDLANYALIGVLVLRGEWPDE